MHEHLRHGLGGRRRLCDFDADRVRQERVGETLNLRRHGGREEQGLARERDQLCDALDVGNEAHVEHAVGFVDHEDLDAGHQQLAALAMVEQTARRCDQDVDTPVELLFLLVERHAADQKGDVQLVVLAVLVEVFLDLRSKLAGRLEDQRARHARASAALLEQGDHRQCERSGLARSGLCDAEDIAPGENMRDGLRLDRRRRRVTASLYGRQHFGAQSERGEGHVLKKGPKPDGTARVHVAIDERCTQIRGFAPTCQMFR
jgi:hypothetical protein